MAEPRRHRDGERSRRHKRRRNRSHGSGSQEPQEREERPNGRRERRRRRRRSSESSGGQRRRRSPKCRDGGPPHIFVEPGQKLGEEGRYLVDRALGDGASGRVLRCHDTVEGAVVAVKVSRPSRRTRRHAETEVAMLRKLQRHDPELARRHVVRLLDTFVHEENFYCIVMEPLAMSLRNLLQEGSSGGLFMADIRLAAFQLTSCLDFFQSLHLAHGDLKCTNVMLRRGDFSLQPHPRQEDLDEVAARPLWPFEVVVIDFGLAHTFEHEPGSGEAFLFGHEEGERSRLRVGARHIRAPEVILGLDRGCVADLWSLGCLLYTLYTGERLFPVHDEMAHLAAIEHITELRVPRAMASRVAERILEKGVAFEPSGRLAWPQCAADEEQVQEIMDMPTLQESVMGKHDTFLSFLQGLLEIDPCRRLTATTALQHPFLHKDSLTQFDSEE